MYQTFACVANINGIWFLYSTNFTSKILKPVLFSVENSQRYIYILVQISSLHYLYKYIEQYGELFRFKDIYSLEDIITTLQESTFIAVIVYYLIFLIRKLEFS